MEDYTVSFVKNWLQPSTMTPVKPVVELLEGMAPRLRSIVLHDVPFLPSNWFELLTHLRLSFEASCSGKRTRSRTRRTCGRTPARVHGTARAAVRHPRRPEAHVLRARVELVVLEGAVRGPTADPTEQGGRAEARGDTGRVGDSVARVCAGGSADEAVTSWVSVGVL